MSESFEVRKIEPRYNGGGLGVSFAVEIYYPKRLHSVCYQMFGQDEMEVLARIHRTHDGMKHMFKEDT